MSDDIKILVSKDLDFKCKGTRFFDLLAPEQRKSIIDYYGKPLTGIVPPVNPIPDSDFGGDDE